MRHDDLVKLLNSLSTILIEGATPASPEERRRLLIDRLRAAGFTASEAERIARVAFDGTGDS